MCICTQDFVGQYRAEMLYRIIVSLFGFVGIAWGYHVQQFSQTAIILAAGFALAALVTMPPWPMYRRHPLKWQKPAPESVQPVDSATTAAPTTSGGAGDEKTKKKNK